MTNREEHSIIADALNPQRKSGQNSLCPGGDIFWNPYVAGMALGLGLILVSGLGWADLTVLSSQIVSWTYVWPMLIGGLALGAGFIISGYCPGTAVVMAVAPPTTDASVRETELIGPIPAEVMAYKGRVHALENGFAAWKDYALTLPEPPGPAASEADREAYRFQAALFAALTGEAASAPPPPTPTVVYVPKKKKGGGGGN